ncbi:MAG: SbcC/MukB-like Walker B domain-containing protein, partial [Oscillospiraceae bacterium]
EQTNKTLEDVTSLKDKLSNEVGRYAEAIRQQTSQLLQIAKNKLQKQTEFAELIASKGLTIEAYNLRKADAFKLAEYEKSLFEYVSQVTKCDAIVDSLTLQLENLSPVNLDVLQNEYDEILGKIALVTNEISKLSITLSTNTQVAKKLDQSYLEWENLSITLNEHQRFYDIANGKFSDKINFERYVLASYFNDVIKNANIRLEQMTNSRYTLNRRTDKEKGNKSSGLALEVFDAYTGASRHVNTLSGGESFKISLCLALGLADIISQNSGGIELNTMFIDEGFGSLDSASLDAAIECLNDLKSTGRYIGIISHVSELQDKIPSKLFVVQEPQGSYIKMQE